MPLQCKRCGGNDLLGLCTMRDCDECRLVCFECKERHAGHPSYIVQLKNFKNPQQISNKLIENEEVFKKYSKYEYDQDLQKNATKIQSFREAYNLQKQKIIEQFVKLIDDKVETKISNLIMRSEELERSENLYKDYFQNRLKTIPKLVDAYLNSNDELEEQTCEMQLNQYFREDQDQFDQNVLQYQKPNNNIQELGTLYKQNLNKIEKQLKLVFLENWREVNDLQNNSVEQLQKLLEKKQKQKIEKKNTVQQFSKKLMSFYIGNSQQQIEMILQSELKELDYYYPLMKLYGKELNYDSKYWTEDRITVFQPFNKHDFDQIMVREQFITQPVKLIKIEVIDENNQSRYTILEKSQNRPLQEEFKQKDKSIELKYVGGVETPLELFCGSFYKSIKNHKPYWRINSFDAKNNRNMRVRLGGFFSRNPNKERKDLSGFDTSLECSGLGITDTVSYHLKHANRSAGVRQWSDENTLLNKNGQIYCKVNLYGK